MYKLETFSETLKTQRNIYGCVSRFKQPYSQKRDSVVIVASDEQNNNQANRKYATIIKPQLIPNFKEVSLLCDVLTLRNSLV